MDKIARILMVDDDEQLLRALTLRLKSFDYDIVPALNGPEALAKFQPGLFDIVITDLIMPKMNGIELLEEMRKQDSEVAFIMITGHPSVETAVKAMKRGAYDYIIKPIDTDELNIRIERTLETKKLKGQVKSVQWILWALIISIPIWLIIGIILARLLK